MFKGLLCADTKPHITPEIINTLRLIRSENVGPRTFFALVSFFGNSTTAIENIAEFSLRGGRTKPIKICSYETAIKELELLHKNHANIVSYNCGDYSKLLSQIHDAPPILTYKGNIELLSNPQTIAIVGARNASVNGRFFASKIAKELSAQNYVIASGFARGIDTAAHSVNTKNTIAVLAGGIDYIYPPENHKLYEKIANEGLVIAELPIGAKPLAQHFPRRNRLISGLSLGVVIIEASLKSGSLITAKYALEQNREIFALPGFPLDPRNSGANKLIKDGAHLIESTEDIIANLTNYGKCNKLLEELQRKDNNCTLTSCKSTDTIDDNMRRAILATLSSTPVDFDDIINASAIPASIVCSIMIELELARKVIRHQRNKFCLTY